MKVVLAGYNIESQGIDRLNETTGGTYTPEVLSAAYARITRDPRRIETLRREAREQVEKSRARNERIVFGLGHRSIAEHAVFNFDIAGISRLAVEEIEHFRLVSYTEKSQRYIKLGKDLVVPLEIRRCGKAADLERAVVYLHRAYEKLYRTILDAGGEEGVSKEDARYLMPLATVAQLGMTINARELEYMIGRLASHRLDEMRRLADLLYEAALPVAPSLLRYPEPTAYFEGMPSVEEDIMHSVEPLRRGSAGDPVDVARLVDVTPGGDRRLVASLLFRAGRIGMEEAERIAGKLGRKGRGEIVRRTFRDIESYDSVWREFENIHFLFEAVVSCSCFAQLKRHRMSTLIAQPYDLALGITIPPSVRRSKAVSIFRGAVRTAERLHRSLMEKAGDASAYALTNAHRRRVLFGINLRELYHFSRLRSDRHAQWEIRTLSERLCTLASERLPAGTQLLGGKDSFADTKRSLFE